MNTADQLAQALERWLPDMPRMDETDADSVAYRRQWRSDYDLLRAYRTQQPQQAEQGEAAPFGHVSRIISSVKEQREAFPGEEPDYLWVFTSGTKHLKSYESRPDQLEVIRLYTSPPKREPLTDEEIDEVPLHCETAGGMTEELSLALREFARAIERAHHIGE